MSPSLQIFRAACDELGKMLSEYGFKYSKTNREALRTRRLFQHCVGFRTSRSTNSLPGHVELDVWASARSEALGDFRRRAGIELRYNGEYLFSNHIENLFVPGPPYIRYDIGDQEARPVIMAGIVRVLQMEVMQAFELIESPMAVRNALDAQPIPWLPAEAIRDYFGCFGFSTGDSPDKSPQLPGMVLPEALTGLEPALSEKKPKRRKL